MPNRRNLTEREIVERAAVDLSSINLTRSGTDPAATGTPIDGGGFGDNIGVPTNFRVIAQEVIDFSGEYRVNVIIEFDGVAGADEYEPRLREQL